MVRDADTPAITPSFTSMLPAFSGSFTDANGFTGAAISKPPVSLSVPCPDTEHTSPSWSNARSATDAGIAKRESIWPTAPPSDGTAAAPENALSNPMGHSTRGVQAKRKIAGRPADAGRETPGDLQPRMRRVRAQHRVHLRGERDGRRGRAQLETVAERRLKLDGPRRGLWQRLVPQRDEIRRHQQVQHLPTRIGHQRRRLGEIDVDRFDGLPQ